MSRSGSVGTAGCWALLKMKPWYCSCIFSTRTRLSEPTREVVGVVTAHIDINTATAEELIALPGIGEVYSQRIIESRTTDGPFATTDELVERDLIPRSTYERIRNLITVGP